MQKKPVTKFAALLICVFVVPAFCSAQVKKTAPKYPYKIEEIELKNTPYLYTNKHASQRNVTYEIGFGLMMNKKVMEKQNLKMVGPPFCIYHKMDTKDIIMDVCVPVDRTPADDQYVKAGKIKPGKAIVVHYFGAYTLTSKGHDAAKKYIANRKKTITGYPWEAYITDPAVEVDTAKWQTDIYYPVK